ncbi:hypothetical protein HN51_014914 [Arachis hypogaea]|uniref:DUF761 domain-containing protein n=2 Tax=Arachis TaxID=3817 RepID=A0A445CML6_ARAHY|nr:uncharacterized protein LOC107492426 [Arachis duranensis]XP_057722913.1 uncharacterized protein LOC130936777 [Arachis stenosperma]QHO45056.1 uncharacterized protein DS421_6g175830 [Arachis hypogaea]RYR52174.1 hypothetical protein Ahy_A06g027089 [Arachis hypogaea]
MEGNLEAKDGGGTPRRKRVLSIKGALSRIKRKKLGGSTRSLSSLSQSPFDGDGTLKIPSRSNNTDFFADDSSYSPSPSSSSRYSSNQALNEMVQGDDDGEIKQDNVVAVSLEDGDSMIDAKADEFIAQFYRQMRLQRMDHMDPLYRERSHRSLGW